MMGWRLISATPFRLVRGVNWDFASLNQIPLPLTGLVIARRGSNLKKEQQKIVMLPVETALTKERLAIMIPPSGRVMPAPLAKPMLMAGGANG